MNVAATKKRPSAPTCVGCDEPIHDQYILHVAPDLNWHSSCLCCVVCSKQLDEQTTCFVREDKTYCKNDYLRLYSTKCCGCSITFSKTDLVMKARDQIYHLQCFKCTVCDRQLVSGEHFAMSGSGQLLCRADHEIKEPLPPPSVEEATRDSVDDKQPKSVSVINNNNNNDDIKSNGTSVAEEDTDSPTSPAGVQAVQPQSASSQGGTGSGRNGSKTTRVRTVLNEKQLHTLRTCYGANPRPDALMKEQLVEMTGLSPRVIRVWFQNKRCKDKKKTILMKQIQQQQQQQQDKAVPMVASSPVRHEPPQLTPVKVHQYPTAWKFLGDFDADSAPPFQKLMTSFAESSDDDDTVISMDDSSRGYCGLNRHTSQDDPSRGYCALNRHTTHPHFSSYLCYRSGVHSNALSLAEDARC